MKVDALELRAYTCQARTAFCRKGEAGSDPVDIIKVMMIFDKVHVEKAFPLGDGIGKIPKLWIRIMRTS